MVFPATANFQIAARKALPNKAALPRQGNRSMVSRLNAGFQPVELEFAEGVVELEQHPLMHQLCSPVRREAVVTEKRTLEETTNQVVQIDDPNDVASGAADDKKTAMRVRGDALQITTKCLGSVRR